MPASITATPAHRRLAPTVRAVAASLLLLPASTPLVAQAARPDAAIAGPLFTTKAAWLAAGTVLGTAALTLADRGITEELRDPGPQRSGMLRSAARGFNWLGDPGTVVISAALYGSGRLLHHPPLAELGLRSAEALAISGAATALIKGLAGRDRPYLNDRDPDDYAFGHGFGRGGHTSFPSGHATAAFAVASVVAAESGLRWPRAARFVTPIAYAMATSVALARIYDDKHWASDVFAGAGIGTLAGLTVVRYHRLHPHSRLDRWLLDARVTVTGRNELGLFWSVAAP